MRRRAVSQPCGAGAAILAATMDVPRFLEFSVRHAPRFDEWAAETRSALLLQYTTALGVLVREAMGQWRWREAVELADRWLACDPLSDEAARLAVESRYLAGNRGAALARFAEYRVLLLRETGCEPSRGLLTLVRRVRGGSSSWRVRPGWGSPAWLTTSYATRWPRARSPSVGADTTPRRRSPSRP